MTANVLALAMSIQQLPAELGRIFYFVVLPILLLAGVGFLLQRKLGLDMPTLTRLNFHFVIPALIYFSLLTNPIPAADALKAIVFTLAMLVALAAVTYLAARARKVPRDQRRAMLMTTMFYNSGNYGLPLQGLAFRPAGLADWAMGLQIFVVLVQNFTGFTVGVLLAAGGRRDRHWKQNLLHIAKFPPLYALAAALITIQVRTWLGDDAAAGVGRALEPFWDVIRYVKEAFLATALLTLGAQLALVSGDRGRYPITLSVVLRLLVGPALGLGLIYLLGLRGILAQMLLIGTGTPTAVNCMLMCLQFDNHPDYATKAVFYSTLVSPVTVTVVIFLARSGLLPGFAV